MFYSYTITMMMKQCSNRGVPLLSDQTLIVYMSCFKLTVHFHLQIRTSEYQIFYFKSSLHVCICLFFISTSCNIIYCRTNDETICFLDSVFHSLHIYICLVIKLKLKDTPCPELLIISWTIWDMDIFSWNVFISIGSSIKQELQLQDIWTDRQGDF